MARPIGSPLRPRVSQNSRRSSGSEVPAKPAAVIEGDWPVLPPEEHDAPDVDEHKVFGLGILSADDRQPAYGQGVVISLLSAAALLLLAIIAIGDSDGTNPPVLQRADTLFWVISGIVLVLTAGGAQYAERVAAEAADESGSGYVTVTVPRSRVRNRTAAARTGSASTACTVSETSPR